MNKLRIDSLASVLGLGSDDVEPQGWYKAKLALGLERRLADRPAGRYICVTAINPTPLGEGKTVTAIGLAMALCRLGRRAIVTLREPSLGPLFGIKGGGAGGGQATLFPADDINLHFTGDIHAVATATNLLAALVDNHTRRGLAPRLDPHSLRCRRAIDLCDRSLESITTGLAFTDPDARRAAGFDLAPASEVMAILGLADSLTDLRQRLGRILVGERLKDDPVPSDPVPSDPVPSDTSSGDAASGEVVSAEQLGFAGALAALLRDAVRPNLVQTCEGTPALVHTGPFANIAHGNSSILSDLAAIRLADYVVTESGFGAECGLEKLMHIKCRASGLLPSAAVLVCTARALKFHSGRFDVRPGRPLPASLLAEDLDALDAGGVNLRAHLELLERFGIPAVVAINRFPDDSPRELQHVAELARRFGAREVAVSDAFAAGGVGAESLAAAVERASQEPPAARMLYSLDDPPLRKLEILATQVYGGLGVELAPLAVEQLGKLERGGHGKLPVCIAKTQYSLSHDPTLVGRPRDFRVPIHEVRVAAGAGFLYALAGDIRTMPGLPSRPAALRVDLDPEGHIRW